MPLSDDEKWMLPENLRRQEDELLAQARHGEDIRSAGDFGAYHALLCDNDPEPLRSHAISDTRYIASYARQLREIVPDLPAEGATILDVGCGPGFLTAALAAGFPGSRAVGIDLSKSGIEYARKAFPQSRFDVVAFSRETELGARFDLVHAREFYPFTRTGDFEFQRGYLEALVRHVAPNGALALALLEQPRSVLANLPAVTAVLEESKMTPLRRAVIASSKLPGCLPAALARLLTAGMLRVGGRGASHFYLSRRLG